jgi:hypothetical protein
MVYAVGSQHDGLTLIVRDDVTRDDVTKSENFNRVYAIFTNMRLQAA